MSRYLRSSIFKIFTFCLFSYSSVAAVRLPALISDGMVLQRNSEVSIWGWGNPGEVVQITFLDNHQTVTTGRDGKWKTSIKTGNAGGRYTMSITGTNTIVLRDILLGDVFLCSGQSNMAFKMERVEEKYSTIIAQAANDHIRLITIAPTYHPLLQDDVQTDGWKHCNPTSVLSFSAVGYFFAKDLYEQQKVPLGLINASYSATKIEGWLSKDVLREFPDLLKQAGRYKNIAEIESVKTKEKKEASYWFSRLDSMDGVDRPEEKNLPGYVTAVSGWKTISVPGFWSNADLKNFIGSVWFKKAIFLPEKPQEDPIIYTGAIDDKFTLYVNGTKIGSEWQRGKERHFTVPAGALQRGQNEIVLRIVNPNGPGGFYKDRPYEMRLGSCRIGLTGTWHYKTGTAMPVLPTNQFVKFNLIPSFLYNGMIAPITNFNIKGILWYQGEGNTGRPEQYASLFRSLIADWRSQWNNDKLSFLFVQLSSYQNPGTKAEHSKWALLRQAQTEALLLPKTGMAVTYDIGETNNIHPANKRDVGKRLSLVARHIIYEEQLVSEGPRVKSATKEKEKIIIEFHTPLSPLTKKGDLLKGFEIAGADSVFVSANASIINNKVVLHNKKVIHPLLVRYAWSDDSSAANLFNKDGLPALPFHLVLR